MRYYLPETDQVLIAETEPAEWAVPLYDEPTIHESASFVPGTHCQHSFDSVSLGLLKECSRKYYFTIILGYHEDPVPIPLTFGIGVHICMDVRHRLLALGYSQQDTMLRCARLALLLGEYLQSGRTERTKETLCRTVIWYCLQFEDDTIEVTRRPNGEPATEYSFTIPLADENGLFVINGQQLYLCGHIDAVVMFLDNLYLLDYKTTKGSLSQNYFDEYKVSYQMQGYFAAAHAMSAVPTSVFPSPPAGVIIDGIELGVNYNRFSRQIVSWTSLQMEQYLTGMKMLIEATWFRAEKGVWEGNEKSCIGRWGRCAFFDVCTSTPAKQERMLEAKFKKRTWDPRKER